MRRREAHPLNVVLYEMVGKQCLSLPMYETIARYPAITGDHWDQNMDDPTNEYGQCLLPCLIAPEGPTVVVLWAGHRYYV